MIRHFLSLTSLSLILLTLSGCFTASSRQWETAKHIAVPSQMVERKIDAGTFVLTVFERIHNKGGPAHIYIEGDDYPSLYNSLSGNPASLHLASRDKAKNVIYISRPCQFKQSHSSYIPAITDEECDTAYTAEKRFAPEALTAYNAALDEVKKRYNLTTFDLYGHSSGGGLAVILGAQRKDVSSITTVAGLLDTKASYDAAMQRKKVFNKYAILMTKDSLNPADFAPLTSRIPQYHYIGGADVDISPAVLYSYLSKIGQTNCTYYNIIQENTHKDGWVEKWPELLKDKPRCKDPLNQL